MSFKTENREVRELFKNNIIFDVPRYQRDYVWGEKNWEELFIDIEFSINNEIEWSHFLGTIVLEKKKDDRVIITYDVVDGQQRITTLFIMLIAIKKKFLLSGKEQYQGTSKSLNDYLFTNDITNGQFKKLNNDKYNNIIDEILTNSFEDETYEITDKGNVIYQMFEYFEKKFNNYKDDSLLIFYKALLCIKIVEIVSETSEEIFNIFEVLNARGKQLKQIELLQNHILKYISPREYIDVEKKKFNEIFNLIDENIRDDFLHHFSKSYLKNSFPQNDVYRSIKSSINITDLSKMLNDLHEYAIVYNKIIFNETNFSLEYFKITRNKQVRPLICSIMLKENILSEKKVNALITNIRNFFFKFNVAALTSNSTDSLIKNCAFSVYNSTTKTECLKYLNDFFVDLSNKFSAVLDSRKFKENIKNNGKYSYSNKYKSYKRNGKLVKYVLTTYNNYYSDNILSIHQMEDLTIEHLLGDVDKESKNLSILKLTIVDKNTNNNKLKNKSLVEKVEILEKSNIYNNCELLKYFENDKLDWEMYEKKFLSNLDKQVFQFLTKL